MAGEILKNIIEFLYPAKCISCGKYGELLCSKCCARLPRIFPPICEKCGKPESSGGFCPVCWSFPTKIDGIRSVFRFDGVIRQAIHELKYYHLKAVSKDMAQLLFSYLNQNQLQVDVFVPVPLHKKRLRQRGYNQSYLIASELGKLTDLPVIPDCLFRIKDSVAQARSSTVEQRRLNVTGAFTCISNKLKDKKIIVIDDVCTSGATLESCAIALKEVGAASVWGLTVAREI